MKNFQKLNIVWGIFVVLIFSLLTVFGFVYKNKSKAYKDLEDKLEQAEKKYVEAKFLYPDQNKSIKTSSEILINEGYLDNLKVNDEECKGYVVVRHDSMVFEYKGYVSCNKYQTKGYEK